MSNSVLVMNEGNVVNDVHTSRLVDPEQREPETSAVMHRSLHRTPLYVIDASGNRLTLSNGQSILDASGGAAVACIGHGQIEVQKALVDQMAKVSYCHSLFYATQAAEDLATLLMDSTCGEMTRVFFISSGSEAMEAALKLARQYHLEKPSPEHQRSHFISRQQSYHGTTLGALSAGGHVARRAIFEPILSDNTSQVRPCYAYRGIPTNLDTEAAYVEALEAELDAEFRLVGPQNVAAFIAEPVVGAALGCVPSVPGYFKAVKRVCDRYGALLIFDEVMCGAGRVGPEPSERFPLPLHAWQDPLIGVVPDIMTMGKGLGGGYMPIAAMLTSRRVVSALQQGSGAFSHGQTYQGHPLACRAALQVQRIIQQNKLVDNVRKQVGDIRGKGLFWGIEFVRSKATKAPFEPSAGIAMGIHELGMQEPHNISLYPGTGSVDGRRGDHIILAPPYNTTAEEIQNIADITSTVIEQYFLEHQQEWLVRSIGDVER